MGTFLLTWNPTKWTMSDEELAASREATWSGEPINGRWSVGNRRTGIEPGDLGFLVRQHDRRGILASGIFSSIIEEDRHWDGTRGKTTNYCGIIWDTWLDVGERLPIERLVIAVPQVPWNVLLGSGVRVPDDAEETLVGAWDEHLDSIGWEAPSFFVKEADQETLPEGAAVQVLVNRYERNARARTACIEKWGVRCVVCGFDFEERYGPLGKGFANVHHLTDLSLVGDGYRVNPTEDLRPVCPNCHAMLHRQVPAFSIQELKRRLRQRS